MDEEDYYVKKCPYLVNPTASIGTYGYSPCCSAYRYSDKPDVDVLLCRGSDAESLFREFISYPEYMYLDEFRFSEHSPCKNCTCQLDGVTNERRASISFWHKCPSKCVTCFNSKFDFHDETVFSDETIDMYLRWLQNSGYTVYEIGGGGDIFYSENYANILGRDLTQYGVNRIDIITNMQLFDEQHVRTYINEKNIPLITRIYASCDGHTPELYQKIRAGSSFARFVNNINNLPNVIAFPDLQINHTISMLNKDYVEDFIKFCRNDLTYKPNVVILSLANVWFEEMRKYVLPENERLDFYKHCCELAKCYSDDVMEIQVNGFID